MPLPELSRRRVLTSSAWAVPAVTVASAAPAFAGSGATPLVDYVLDWPGSGYQYDSARAAYVAYAVPLVADPAHERVLVTIRSSFAGGMEAHDHDGFSNMTISSATVGGLGVRGLTLAQRQSGSSYPLFNDRHQKLEFSFDRSVSNLRVPVADVDAEGPLDTGSSYFSDLVWVGGDQTAPGWRWQSGIASMVGAHGSTPVALNSRESVAEGTAGQQGNDVALAPGDVAGFVLLYANQSYSVPAGVSGQHIHIAPLTFRAPATA